jgi:protein gp37
MSKKKTIQNPEMGDSGKSWNVVTGCDKYSDGCLNCYAEDVVKWLQGKGQKAYIKNGFNLTLHHHKLDWPLTHLAKKPKKPAKSFVTDMGDLFHVNVPDKFIFQVFDMMLQVPQHRFYVLTKRAKRFGQLAPQLTWRPWMWAGVTVESEKYLDRIDHLKKLPTEVNKFIMMEPLLSQMPKLDLNGIDWVVVGGETNSKGRFRPIRQRWVTDIRDQVKSAGLPFMFKHWPDKSHNSRPALLQGKIWKEYPPSLLKNIDWL